jgi:hypothetical protein
VKRPPRPKAKSMSARWTSPTTSRTAASLLQNETSALDRPSTDPASLLETIDVAIVFLERNLRIQRFIPRCRRVIDSAACLEE